MDNPNDLHHIFGNPGHNLGPLVEQCGSSEAAGSAIQRAAENALDRELLQPGVQGVFETIVDIEGSRVTVRGRIGNGAVRIGSAWITG